MARLLFITDPLAGFKLEKDSTFAMMRAPQQRGHTLWAATADQLRCRANGPTAQPSITATAITINKMTMTTAIANGSDSNASRCNATSTQKRHHLLLQQRHFDIGLGIGTIWLIGHWAHG